MSHRIRVGRRCVAGLLGACGAVFAWSLVSEACAQRHTYDPSTEIRACGGGCEVYGADSASCDPCCGVCDEGPCGCGGGVSGSCGCGSCGGCGRPSGYWLGADFLLLWTKGMQTPPLATTGTVASEGVLGADGTEVLYGGSDLLGGATPGARFSIGKWLTPGCDTGIGVSYLFLDENSDSFSASEDDFAVLARPFTNVTDAVDDSRLIALDGIVEGTLDVSVESEFDLFDAYYTSCFSKSRTHRADFLFGYRYAELNDSIRIDESTTSLDGVTTGTEFDLTDRFETENRFHGALIGARLKKHYNACWYWDASFKIALGGTERRSTVSGQTITTDTDNNATTTNAGLLAQESNIGTISEDGFGTVSELGLTLRRRIGPRSEFSIGYVLLAWQDVFRAGDQIDTNLNTTQIPPGSLTGPALPTAPAESTGYWAQGLRFGLSGSY